MAQTPLFRTDLKVLGSLPEPSKDWLYQPELLKSIWQGPLPNLNGLDTAIAARKDFPDEKRFKLCRAIVHNYSEFGLRSIQNTTQIESLGHANSYTVCTGHQLNLFTGPAFFISKIASTINLCRTLKLRHPDKNFIPIYWMASEDHDFDEIAQIVLKGQKINWTSTQHGKAVGNIELNSLNGPFEQVYEALAQLPYAEDILSKVKHIGQISQTLVEFTFRLVHLLFDQYGLLILDANNRELKIEARNLWLNDLEVGFNKSLVEDNLQNSSYKWPVNPREINLFYINEEGYRHRIEFQNDVYHVLDTEIRWTDAQIRFELDIHPERFSPNVLLRPLYQETILPNIAYIGGPAELAYWLELGPLFNNHEIPCPVLLHRGSVGFISLANQKKLEQLGLTIEYFRADIDQIVKDQVKQGGNLSDFDSLSKGIDNLLSQFGSEVIKKAPEIEKSFKGEQLRIQKRIDFLKAKELKLLGKKENIMRERIKSIKDEVFPNNSYQERVECGLGFVAELGLQIIPGLIEHLNPLKPELTWFSR